ncbi:MAG: PIN domain-containing protein [Leptothrix sp. (in: Bacteria)]|jgi:hypothetical protein|nr:PIN domain-containing protein [Leptothrix sp. (in: b-proteobacteria)]
MLVDTTVWIDLLRGQVTPAVVCLRQLLDRGEALIAPVIVQEILQGARDADSLTMLRKRFTALPMVEPRPHGSTHADAGALYARCRWAGVTPRSPHDCLIAQLAMENRLTLLHDDRDFEQMALVEVGLMQRRG